jgi:hypothetical protein
MREPGVSRTFARWWRSPRKPGRRGPASDALTAVEPREALVVSDMRGDEHARPALFLAAARHLCVLVEQAPLLLARSPVPRQRTVARS